MSSRFTPNDSMFLRPVDLPQSAWTGHIPFGMWLVQALRPRLLVELGTHHGASYLGFCQAMLANKVEGRCLAVDTWAGDEHAGAYGNEVIDALRALHDHKYGTFSELLRMTFDDALECVADGSVDLLHIDGLHTYEAVKHDFETWRPKLSDRAVVLFHDIEVRDRGFGVWRFWDEVRAQHPAFAFVHSHGLGVLLFGTQLPQPVRDLATLEGAERTHVQSLFERLGDGLMVRTQAEELERVVAGKEEGIAAYRANAEALGGRVDALQEQIAGLVEEVHARDRLSVAAHGEIDSLRGRLVQADLDTRSALLDAAQERERLAADCAAAMAESARRLDESHGRVLSLTSELEVMRNSRSWRMTAWVRKLASLARGQG